MLLLMSQDRLSISQEKYSYLDVAVFYKYEYDSQLFD